MNQLKYLRDVQDMDLNISAIDHKIEALPIEIQRLMQKFKTQELQYDSQKKEKEELEKKRRIKESGLAAAEVKLDKFNTQLLMVKTNKEYSAMLHEIEQAKNEISHLEEEILRLFDKVEEEEKLLKGEKQRLDSNKETIEKEKTRIEGQLTRLREDRDKLFKERMELFEKINPDLRTEYNKISQARRGLAVVQAKNTSCSGCNIMLMPQLFQEIIGCQDKIFHCPNCNRFLFYDPADNE